MVATISKRLQIGAFDEDALNIIRWLSTFAIVICHILQANGSIWAYTFNIGVQIFFLLSGFLYGGRRITDIKKFYWGRFKKLYIPFICWCSIFAIVVLLFAPDRISLGGFISQVAMLRWLPGQEHLWFMQVIFVCYVLVPFVDLILTKNVSITVILSIILATVVLHIHYTPTIIWIMLYFVGYAMGRWRFLIPYGMIASAVVTIWLSVIYTGGG